MSIHSKARVMVLKDDVSLPSESSSFAEQLDTLDQLLCSESKSGHTKENFDIQQVSSDEEGSFIQVPSSGEEESGRDYHLDESRKEDTPVLTGLMPTNGSGSEQDHSGDALFPTPEEESHQSATVSSVTTTGNTEQIQGEAELNSGSRNVNSVGCFAYWGASVDTCIMECASFSSKLSKNVATTWKMAVRKAALSRRLVGLMSWTALLFLILLCLYSTASSPIFAAETTNFTSLIPVSSPSDAQSLPASGCATDIGAIELTQEATAHSETLRSVDLSSGSTLPENHHQRDPNKRIFPKRPESLTESLSQAEDYQRQIYKSPNFPATILDDLVRGGLWNQWTMYKQRNFILGFFYTPNQVKDLRSIIAQIQNRLVTLLRHDIDGQSISEKSEGRKSGFILAKSRARDAMTSFRSYHEFTKLASFHSSLIDDIASTLRPEIQTFEEQMASLFVSLSTAMQEAISDPGALCEALDFARSSHFLRVAQEFIGEPLPNECGQTRRDLVESVANCINHSNLQREAKNLILKHSRILSTFTFDLSGTDNEHERLYHFERVRQSLEFVASGACLRNSPSLADGDAMMPDFQDQRTKALAEIHNLGDVVSDVLGQFPNHLVDFPVLRRAIGNLETLSAVFREQDPSLASAARNHLHGAAKAILVRLEEYGAVSCGDYDSVLYSILQLKRASREVNLWVTEINTVIDQCLDKGAKLATNTGRFLLTLSHELQTMTGQDSPIAKQLISEHKCFEWAVNAIFNAATARQGIDYVIEKMKLDSYGAFRLKVMYEAFDIEYTALLHEGFPTVHAGRSKPFLGQLITNAKEISNDMSLARSDRTWMVSAYLFAYWTLENATNLSTLPDGMDDFSVYLKKPHAPQVAAVWLLLGIVEPSNMLELENRFVELKTGEGKSVVLGIASIILALSNFDVTVICYSSYLSQRDFSDFKGMFENLGVDSMIEYRTAEDLAESLVSKFGDLRLSAKNLILGKAMHESTALNDSGNPTILLVDEVDVFFKGDILGQGYRPAVTLQSAEAEELLFYIWEHRNHLTREKLLMSEAVKKCLGAVDSRFHRLVQHEALSMLNDAQNSENWEPYALVEEKIGYKHFDGMSFSMTYGYETMFAYLSEYEKGEISHDAVVGNLGLEIRCGELSYAELPNSFDYILGVSGTIRGLSNEERLILTNVYGVEKLSYVPSAYGENQLHFRQEDSHDFILSSTKADFFLELCNEIYHRRKPQDHKHEVQRPVLVFFKNSKELLEFYESKPMKGLRFETRVITEAISPSEKRAAFTKATEQGAITLLIREYGRGTDFKCFDSKMLEAGGTHVIQTFYSEEAAEEIQLKGRTARQGAKGSYSLVLNFEHLASDFGVTDKEFRKMRNTRSSVTLLEQKRNALTREKNEAMASAVEELQSVHYRTLAFLSSRYSADWLQDAVGFVLEQNGLGGPTLSFGWNKLKEEAESKQKLRRVYSNSSPTDDLVALAGRRYGDLTGEEIGVFRENYYELIGLPIDATAISIGCSVRLLQACLRLGSVAGKAEEMLGVLSEARSVLLDQERRVAYDFILGSPRGKYFKAEGGPARSIHRSQS